MTHGRLPCCITFPPSDMARFLHIRGEADHLQHPDLIVRDVELPPPVLIRSAHGIMMMVVVPSFAHGEQCDEPVVAAVIIGLVVRISEQMRERVDRPGDVPDSDGPDENPPDEKARAELDP